MNTDAWRAPGSGLPPEVHRQLAELAARWSLPAAAVSRLAGLLAFIAAVDHAPTTVRDPRRAVEIHIADSLTGLAIPEILAADRIADIGSGAGFPSLPLAVALPRTRLDLVESASRKAEFLRRAAAAVSIGNVEVVASRAEEWEEGRLRNDVVTARALAPLPVLAEYAAPLLRLGGVLVAWKGRRDRDEDRRGAMAAATLGLEPADPVVVDVGPAAEHRHLHVFRKLAETPARFPRRPGMAAKRPLA